MQKKPNKHIGIGCIITLGLLTISTISSSASLKRSSIQYTDKRFLYSFEALVNAEHEKVISKLHNFDQWHKLNDNISKSKVLETLSERKIKRLLTLTQCIFTFCFNLKFVEVINLSANRLQMDIIPGEGSFSAGRAIWETSSDETNRTMIRVNATLTPSFWVPPVIGPLVLEKVFLKQLNKTIKKIETLAESKDI